MVPRIAVEKLLGPGYQTQNYGPQEYPAQMPEQHAERTMHSDRDGKMIRHDVEDVLPPHRQIARAKVSLQ